MESYRDDLLITNVITLTWWFRSR